MVDKYKTNSVNLETLKISGTFGSYDALDSFTGFEIEESMNADSMVCNMTFIDAADISNKIDFDGTESVTIKFSSPGNREVDLEFTIFKHTVQLDPNGGSAKAVTLYGVTPEHYTQALIDINQSFNGPLNKFADTIFSKLRTKRKLETHDTTGIVKTIVPGFTPFESMSFLANRSYDSSFKSCAFKFYETIDGYHFKNVEKVISEEKPKAITYQYNPNANVKVDDKRIQFIISKIDVQANNDVMQKIKSGMYASEAKEIDLINQTVIKKEFYGKEEFDEFEHLDDDAMSLDSKLLLSKLDKGINTSFWLMKNIDNQEEETHFTQIIPGRLFYLSSLEQVKARMGIPGNSDLSPGKVINLDMAEVTAKTEFREQEAKITGNYLVTKVTHLVERGNYQSVVEMCKDSYRSNVRRPHKHVVSTRKPRATI
tara:strand:- start:1369 stop:2649 length:1281 start_codon:yes stop_codon:yes gene_type:complete